MDIQTEEKIEEVKRGRGQPAIELTEEQIEQIQTMAGLGLNIESIGRVLKISAATLQRMRKRNSDVDDAVLRGRDIANTNVATTAYKMATNGKNPTMTQFFLKARAGWSEKTQIEFRAEILFATRIGLDGVLRQGVEEKQDLSTELLEAAYADLDP